jgi:hypothetical protein
MMINLSRRAMALATIPLAVASACSSDPTDVHIEEVEAVELVLSGVTVAVYEAGAWTGELNVDVGEETAHIDVVFLDHDGDEISFTSDYYLEVEVEDESIAEFEQDTPGEFGGHLRGLQVGSTTLTFFLMHGAVGSGHADFQTNPTGAGVTANVN